MNTIEPQTQIEEKPWFYEQKGQRKGAFSEIEIIELINNETLSYGTSVWKKGYPEWMRIENTELRAHLEKVVPPPLTGEHVSNSLAWVLAFAPIIGLFLQYFVAGVVHPNNVYLAESEVLEGNYWYITLILNIVLSVWDEKRLKKAGTNTKAFRGWLWLLPVYLFQRAKALKQNQAYFTGWIICFVISIAITS